MGTVKYRPLVQHANERTDYKLVVHPYRPKRCNECKRIRDFARSVGMSRAQLMEWIRFLKTNSYYPYEGGFVVYKQDMRIRRSDVGRSIKQWDTN